MTCTIETQRLVHRLYMNEFRNWFRETIVDGNNASPARRAPHRRRAQHRNVNPERALIGPGGEILVRVMENLGPEKRYALMYLCVVRGGCGVRWSPRER